MPKEKKPDFPAHLKNHTILTGDVVYCVRRKDGKDKEKEELCVDCHGSEVFIKREDAVLYAYSDSLSKLVGDKVKFCITEIEEYGTKNEKIWGSMKEAKKVLVAPVMERLLRGEVCTGTVWNAVSYGAYIVVGDVRGLMKNTDFTDDDGEIRWFYRRGDKIRVKYKKTSEKGQIYFLPEEKKKGVSAVSIDNVKPDMVMAGKIVNSYPDRVYVNVLPGVDVLCFCPENLGELRDNDRVQVRIRQIYKDGDKLIVKGKIIGKKSSETNLF